MRAYLYYYRYGDYHSYPKFQTGFFDRVESFGKKNAIGTQISMLSFLPSQVLNFAAKGTYRIFSLKAVRKKKWSTKRTPPYLELFFKVIVSCEFWGVNGLDERLPSLMYVFRNRTATFSMFFFQYDSEGSYQTYLVQQNCFNVISSMYN